MKENEEEAIRLEKASMEPNYTKEKIIRNYEKHEVCFQQEYFEDSKEEHGCYMQINETINLKSNESSVYVSADVFDRGKFNNLD